MTLNIDIYFVFIVFFVVFVLSLSSITILNFINYILITMRISFEFLLHNYYQLQQNDS